MFANTAPFQAAERERTATLLKTAEDKLYTELTDRFQADARTLEVALQDAIRTAATPREFRTPLWVYNRVQWTQSRQEMGQTRWDHCVWEIDNHDHETRVRVGSFLTPVHRLLPALRPRLGSFFGDHFTVSTQVHKVLAVTPEYTALQVTVYLNYWTHPVRTTDDDVPPSPICSNGDHAHICYCNGGDD